ncbi:S1C family serine protease [Aridibaculum aurantiacum]|uniref:S1C family serine protease n=1 Tax=Aridibaculum aurantiacum TaxID=2810307 RepID=UPI001A97020A|nr:serine protease [Aridibaculum aurantiacum]
MEDILLFDAIERYLDGKMSAEEKAWFEDLRNNNPEVDQLVVEHNMFLHQMDNYSSTRAFKHELQNVHCQLVASGAIKETPAGSESKVILLWRKYKRVTAIAAIIAFVTTLFISSLVSYYAPAKADKEIRELSRVVKDLHLKVNVQNSEINQIKTKVPLEEKAKGGGTSFLIDGSGLLVTNAHVVRGASTILLQNTKGQQFKATIVHLDEAKDLAILKIEDADYKPFAQLPYSIRNTSLDLGEPIFTLGYPRDEIVYNEGYTSAKTGFNGDTVTCQIAVAANPGNSGGPVLNKNGEVVGVVSTSQTTAEGVVFAIKSKNIHQALDELKRDTSFQKTKLPAASSLKGLDRVQQIKQIQDCVFMVKTFTR